jgi:hypothetical protein
VSVIGTVATGETVGTGVSDSLTVSDGPGLADGSAAVAADEREAGADWERLRTSVGQSDMQRCVKSKEHATRFSMMPKTVFTRERSMLSTVEQFVSVNGTFFDHSSQIRACHS